MVPKSESKCLARDARPWYDINAHPFTIAGCLVSWHIDKSRKTPKGSLKATLAWAVGPSPNHYRNIRILVAEGKSQYGLQDENPLDCQLPAHVKKRRLPYHSELAAAIKDLTAILKKTPPTEATGTPIFALGQSHLEAATHAHHVFGTPQRVLLTYHDAVDKYADHYHQPLEPTEPPSTDYSAPSRNSINLPQTAPLRAPTTRSQTNCSASRQRAT